MSSAPAVAARVIPDNVPLTQAEAEAVLEIAYLAISADHTLADSELESFRGVMKRLESLPKRGDAPYRAAAADRPADAPVSDRRLNDLLDRLNAKLERADVDERLRELAKGLSLDARGVAYKVAHAIYSQIWTPATRSSSGRCR